MILVFEEVLFLPLMRTVGGISYIRFMYTHLSIHLSAFIGIARNLKSGPHELYYRLCYHNQNYKTPSPSGVVCLHSFTCVNGTRVMIMNDHISIN